jgi:hypothetical protein
MCDVRTVEGILGEIRSISGEEGISRTINGEDAFSRNISGLGGGVTLLGTKPTYTQRFGGSGTYTTPVGCVYIDVYVVGAGGGGAGGTSTTGNRHGGGGGAGSVALGTFVAGTYAYDIKVGGTGGAPAVSGNISAGVTSFSNVTVSSGGAGLFAEFIGSDLYAAAAPGVTNNSRLPLGNSQAHPPSRLGSRGGGSLLLGRPGGGPFSISASENGLVGDRGGGGGGGANIAGSGANGASGYILIIEYY